MRSTITYLDVRTPRCKVCGGPLTIFEEAPCRLHEEPWFFVTHYCSIDIEFRQKGGTLEDVQRKLEQGSEIYE